MGVGRIFSREWPLLDFTKFILGGTKVVKFGFHHSKLKKQHFLLNISKAKRGQVPPLPPFPTPMSDSYLNVGNDALKKLLLFPSTYLCESGFSTLLYVKIKNRN